MSSGIPGTESSDFQKAILDAMPNPIFVVDEDVRILHCNPAAQEYLHAVPDLILNRRGGEALHCIHAAETPGGCGAAPSCRGCIVRNSVKQSFTGATVSRRRHRMKLVRGGDQITEIHVLVTTAPMTFAGSSLALLVLEDISELVALRGIVPMCCGCRKIRNDDLYWQHVETYFKEKLDIDFSHGLCPDCVRRLYPDLIDSANLIS